MFQLGVSGSAFTLFLLVLITLLNPMNLKRPSEVLFLLNVSLIVSGIQTCWKAMFYYDTLTKINTCECLPAIFRKRDFIYVVNVPDIPRTFEAQLICCFLILDNYWKTTDFEIQIWSINWLGGWLLGWRWRRRWLRKPWLRVTCIQPDGGLVWSTYTFIYVYI